MEHLISVIIPVYNVELYIEECLDSILNQTYNNLEIICVDDCGTDDSIKIVEEYAKKDQRIKIIYHKENQGLGEARNTGLKNATGEYIYFIDSDDFIDLDYIEKLFTAIKINNVEVVINSNIITYRNKNDQSEQFWKKNKFSSGFNQINNEILYELPVMSWCKLYKKSFLDKINAKFIFGLKYEDNYFDAITLIYVEKVFIIDNSKYYYRQRKNSITGNDQEVILHFDVIKIIEEVYLYYKQNNFLHKFKINIFFINHYLNKSINKEEYLKKVKDLFFKMQKDNFINSKIYNNNEIDFFNGIINNELSNIIYIKLFSFIPLLKITTKENKTTIKLFSFILLLIIKRK